MSHHSMAIPSRNKRKARSSPEWETQPQPPSPNPDIPSSSSSVADNFSYPLMKPLVFPPGYRFTPTDEELVLFYLKPLSQGNTYIFLSVPIHQVNIYESNPQQLSEKFEKANEKEWFFITETTKLREGGKNKSRCVNGGYWKLVTSKKINAGQGVVANMNTLNYFQGKQPNGVKGDWIMHEYCFESSSTDNKEKVDHALCKLYLTPTAEKKKKKAEEQNKKKLKIGEGVAIVDVEALETEVEIQQPQMQQPHDIVYQQQPQMQQPHDFVYQQPQYSLPPLDPHQSQPQNYAYLPQQPHDTVYQQPQDSLLQLVPHQPQPQNDAYLPFPSNYDDLIDMFDFQEPPEIPIDYYDILNALINSLPLGEDEESNTSGLTEDVFNQGMKKHCAT